MIAPTDLFNKYKGQTVGTNDSDTGQCVGWYNVGLKEQTGVLYPIQGAYGACDILTANNTRPDILEQVTNNPNDMNQKPTPGDWVIWGGNLPGSGGYGHVAMCMDTPPGQIVSADQNWGGQTVHQVTHDWSYVIGWIHHKIPAPIVPPPDPTIALNAKIVDLTARLNSAITSQNKLQGLLDIANKTIKDQTDQIKDLQIQLATAQDDTSKLNALGVALQWLIKRLGLKE